MNRRDFVALTTVPLLAQAGIAPRAAAQARNSGGLFVCMHEATSADHDFRTAMEGYARAGIRAVEVDLIKVRELVGQGSPDVARRLLADLGLEPVSSSNQLFLDEPGPRRAQAVEDLKWKVELDEAIGCDRLVIPSAASERHTQDDYTRVIDNFREAAEIARPHNVTLMVEHTRASTLIGTLRTAVDVVRKVDHPNLRVMLDTFHFWSGMSKLEDLELLRDGELHHLHFEDVPAEPPVEVFEQRHRVFPGEGIAPLRQIVEVLKRKGYSGPASLEMFDPAIRAMSPYDVAMKARATIEPLLA
ncbi:MAG TPA: sugar phosphate isomerase/epimerase family protein [Gammaproteobacteria bacterium]|nr:sugar phosphate isomerase/epimerase family protein [Gammaproteobacteria bacterium]